MGNRDRIFIDFGTILETHVGSFLGPQTFNSVFCCGSLLNFFLMLEPKSGSSGLLIRIELLAKQNMFADGEVFLI